MSKSETDETDFQYQAINDVHLVGRISAPAIERELPSGDIVVEWRVIVDRTSRSRFHSSRGKGTGKREVDTLDLVAWSRSVQKRALKLHEGDWVDIQGSVRRRFWQAPHGLASRWQVEVHQISLCK